MAERILVAIGILALLAVGVFLLLPLLEEDEVKTPEPTRDTFDPLNPAHIEAVADRMGSAGHGDEAARARKIAAVLRGAAEPDVRPPDAVEDDPEAALLQIREKIEREGETPGNIAALGFVHLNRKEFTEATKEFEKALAISRSDPLALAGKGIALLSRAKFAAAAEALRRACEISPGQPVWLHSLSVALLGAGDVEKALDAALEAVAADREEGRHYASVADCYLRAGREAEAERWYRAAVRLSTGEARSKLETELKAILPSLGEVSLAR